MLALAAGQKELWQVIPLEFSENSFQNLLYDAFCHLVFRFWVFTTCSAPCHLERRIWEDCAKNPVGARNLPDLLHPWSPTEHHPHWHPRQLLRKKGEQKLVTLEALFNVENKYSKSRLLISI